MISKLATYKKSDTMRKDSTTVPPPPGQGKRGVDGYLAYLLRQASAASRLRLERSLAEVGVTVPQFLVLTMLRAYPGASGADLARVALLTPQTVSVITRNLERLGAIEKQPHAWHKRVLQFTLTETGSNLLTKCRTRAMRVEEQLTANLPPKDETVVRRWLVAVAADLGAEAVE